MQDLYELLPESKDGTLLAIDLETYGRDASDPSTYIIGTGGADEDGSWYFDVRSLGPGLRDYVISRLRARHLTSFNVVFDWGFLWAKWGLSDLQWEACSYGLFRQLATEGFKDQKWSLEALEKDVLGWTYSNKALLYSMLQKHGLSKDEMWKLADLEPEDFGRYCAEDADAHYQAYDELTKTVEGLGEAGELFAAFHKGPWFTSAVKLNIEQQLRGIKIDVPRLQAYRETVVEEIDTKKAEFFTIPEVAPAVAEHNQKFIDAHAVKEESKIKKDGTKGKAWDNWKTKLDEIRATNFFNLNSPDQVAWLFFEKLGYPIKEYTDKGKPSTNKKFLMFWGEPGRALARIKKKVKLLGSFIDSCLSLQRDGVLHPETKSIGTITWRAAGGGLDDE